MSNTPAPQNTPQPRKRGGLLVTVVAAVVGCGGWGIFTLSAGEHPQGPTVKINNACAALIGCTTSSGSPPRTSHDGRGTSQEERHDAPQLIPAQDVRAHVLDRRDGPAIVRSTPSVNGHFLYTLDPYHHPTQIKIICQTWADAVQPAKGASTALWDRIGPDEWISDAYLDTGTSRPVTRRCEQPPDEGQPTDGDTTTPD
ncbi:hypothetical protein [Streptomyces sp. NPDC015125]|uniref:hypothetical protein n=1 Tax=Streptomyces sp. NPDC015125 TaxID=3364938 RepID=UPI0036FD437C